MLISIIIPIKDEPSIQEIIDEINKIIKQNKEIIIVDKSKSKPSISGARIVDQKSDGLGNAFVEGLGYARGDIIVLMDGDGSHRPQDLLKMLEKIDESEIVLGSKLIEGGVSNDALGRRIITHLFAWLTRAILWIDIKDPMTGFMLARRDVFKKFKLEPRGFKVVIETVYKSRAKVTEVPILFRERKAGISKVGFNLKGAREISKIIILLFELKWGRIIRRW
ncbi:MAG: glycosyltransferase [Methanotrichaceae archaeon]|nr:glycosyltransferase [Methanotrichaceae archaeon]